jgi:Cu-Zn family superoxide dismutase
MLQGSDLTAKEYLMNRENRHCFSALRALAASALVLGLAACATPRPVAQAVAELQPTRGNSVSGVLHLSQTGDTVTVTGEVHGLKPDTVHGFHVHDKGDCSSGDGVSAGGHFNPGGVAHGQHGHGAHHVGDIPALQADMHGVALVNFSTSTLSLIDPATSVVGRGLIVHRDPDDYTTQPAGNSGPRVACGVIRVN